MRIGLLVVLPLLCIGSSFAGADSIPTESSAFLEYLRGRIQLYSPMPVTAGPEMELTVKSWRGTKSFLVQRLFDACTGDRDECPTNVDKAVQYAARELAEVELRPDRAFAGLQVETVQGVSVENDDGGSLQIIDFPNSPYLLRRVTGMLFETCYANAARQRDQLMELDVSAIASSRNDAFALCERNLAAKIGPMNEAYSNLGPDNIGMVQGSPYESARILLIDQWRTLASKWSGRMLVSVPLSSVVIFTPDVTEAGAQALLARGKAIAATSMDVKAYDVFELTGQGWIQRTHEERGKVRVYQVQ